MAGILAGVAYVDIIPRFTKFNTSLRSQTLGIDKKMQQLGSKMSKSLTVPLVAVGAVSAKLAIDFEASMGQIAALVGLPTEKVNEMKESILNLARDLPQSPKELAEALYFVTSAGFAADDAMKVVEASARAAAAGLGETQIVADAVTSAVNAYGPAALKAGAATDVLLATIREGKGEPDELAGVIGRVIAPAEAMGVAFHEVGGAVASLTLIGLDAAESTTALRGILSTFIKPTSAARGALEDVGLSVDIMREKIAEKGLFAALMDLRQAFGDNKDAIGKVFGNVRALNGFLALTGANASKNEKIFKKLADSTGATDEAFKRASETAQFKLKKALSSLQVAGIKLGNLLLPAIGKIAETVGDMADAFSNLPGPVKKAVAIFGAVVAAVGPLIFIIGKIITAVLFLINPFTLVAIAVIALVVVIVKNWKKITGFFGRVWEDLKNGLAVLKNFFVSTWNSIFNFVKSVWNKIAAFARAAWNMIGRPIVTAVGIWIGIIRTGLNIILTIFRIVFGILAAVVRVALTVIVEIFKVVFAILRPFVQFAWNIIAFIFKAALAIIVGVVRTLLFFLVPIFKAVFAVIKAVVRVAWRVLKAVFGTALRVIIAGVKFWFNVLKTVFVTVFKIIRGVVRVGMSVIKNIILPVIRTIGEVWGKVWGTAKNVLGNVWKGIKAVIRNGVNFIIKFLNFVITGLNKLINVVDVALGPFINLPDIPKLTEIKSLHDGGEVMKTGLAVVHEGEKYSGVGNDFGGGGDIYITLDIDGEKITKVVRRDLLKGKKRNVVVGLG